MEHTVEIKKIIHGGSGLARLDDGMVAMIPFVLPGEKVVIRETRRTRQFVRAELLEILTHSPERIPAPCPYYTRCGGCNLQHADYSGQLSVKASLVEESLSRARVPLLGANINPTMSSPQEFGYRHRIRLHLDVQGRLGFHRAGSKQVIEIKQCLLATKAINRSLQGLRESCFPEQSAKQVKALELIECPATGEVSLVIHPRSRARSVPLPQKPDLPVDHIHIKDTRAYRQGQALTTTTSLKQRFSTTQEKGYTLAWDGHCFFQVNASMNNKLVRLVCNTLTMTPKGDLLDLYCGIGNFSIPLALLGWSVTGVEHNHRSIAWAKYNSTSETGGRARFLCQDVAESVISFNDAQQRFQSVVLDPPRQGLGKQAAADTAALGAKTIVYISCDPATLARDLAVIIEQGYRIRQVTPVDMFPQTHHIESVVVLEKN